MRTFRKFLFSYLGLFLLPVVLLSIFVFQYVGRFCENEAVARNMDSLERLGAVLEENCVQMDSMATLAMRQSEFFARNLRKSSGFYQIEKTLMRWTYTNTFIDDVFFYNSEIGKVYTSYAVYSEEDFYKRYFSGGDLPVDALHQMFLEGPNGRWLVNATKNRDLYYITGRRVNTKQHNVFMFHINTDTLESLVGDSILFDECSTILCSADGKALYLDKDYSEDDITIVEIVSGDNSGNISVNGVNNIYTAVYLDRVEAYLVEIAPINKIFGGILRLETIYFVLLAVVTTAGSIAVIVLMRLNYYPISKIENAMVNTQVLSSLTDDAFVNMNTALSAFRIQNEKNQERIDLMRKEQIVQRLMLGFYKTAEEFNHDANSCDLMLYGTSWRVAVIRAKDAQNERMQLIYYVYSLYPDVLYLEIPESDSYVLIIPTERKDGGRFCDLIQDLESKGYLIRLSSVCTSTASLPAAYASALRSGVSVNEKNNTMSFTKEVLSSLQNAVRFCEKDHVLFALINIRDMLPEIADTRNLLSVTYEALSIVRSALVSDAPITTCRIDELRTGLFEMNADAWKIAEDAIEEVCEMVKDYLKESNTTENNRVNEIQNYIATHCFEQNCSVQEIADHFGMSVSNIAHYFRKYTGYTLSDILQSYRIEKAKQLLKETNMTVAEVGTAVGYTVQATFLRAFKKATGIAPSVFREN